MHMGAVSSRAQQVAGSGLTWFQITHLQNVVIGDWKHEANAINGDDRQSSGSQHVGFRLRQLDVRGGVRPRLRPE